MSLLFFKSDKYYKGVADMSIAVINYMEEEKFSDEVGNKACEFIENMILRNLNEDNDKILFAITDEGVICMPQQCKLSNKRIDAGIINKVFHLAGRYGISSKMVFSNSHGDMLCEFW